MLNRDKGDEETHNSKGYYSHSLSYKNSLASVNSNYPGASFPTKQRRKRRKLAAGQQKLFLNQQKPQELSTSKSKEPNTTIPTSETLKIFISSESAPTTTNGIACYISAT